MDWLWPARGRSPPSRNLDALINESILLLDTRSCKVKSPTGMMEETGDYLITHLSCIILQVAIVFTIALAFLMNVSCSYLGLSIAMCLFSTSTILKEGRPGFIRCRCRCFPPNHSLSLATGGRTRPRDLLVSIL